MVIHLFKNQRRHLLKIYSTTHMVQYIMKKEKNTIFFSYRTPTNTDFLY